MLLLAVCCGTWAESVTYAIRSTSSVETLGTAPQGSSATFSTTYTAASQLTSGNSQTLTLSGYSGVTISKITLSMKSNSKSGAGNLSYSIDNGDNYTYIVGSSSAGVAFNDEAWYGSWATKWVNVEKEVSITPTSSNFIIKIAATANSLYCESYTITYSTGGSQTETCATPSFTPAAGTYFEAQNVTINTSTDGATIYYTTDGTTPTTSSAVYSSPINVATTTTIKAMAAKNGMDNSSVAEATYSIQQLVSGYNIDFESDIAAYSDWEIENIGNTNTAITAHGGSKYGANINASGNGVSTASIQTKEKVANPETFTCHLSKVSNNTTSSTWEIQVSEDGSAWTKVAEHSATSMSAGTWVEFSADLSSYNNVYVRLYYDGSNAVRAVDDISLTTASPGKLSLVGAPIALSFDLYNNSGAQTISYTTESTGNVTVSGGTSYVDVTVDHATKTIIVTPLAVTSDAQTLTVNLAAAGSYPADQATFTVTVADTTPADALDFTWDLSTQSCDGAPNPESINWSYSAASMTNEKGTSESDVNSYMPPSQNVTRFFSGNELTIEPKAGFRIVSVVFTANTVSDAANFETSTWTNATAEVHNTMVTVIPQNNEEAFTASIGADCDMKLVKVYYEQIETHIATFSVNGTTTTSEVAVGENITFPDDLTGNSYFSFKGWTETEMSTPQGTAPEFVTSAVMGSRDVTYYAVFAHEESPASVATKTDNLTYTLIGVTGTSYTDWSGKTSNSNAVYAGNSAGDNESIQLRTKNSESGIVTTTSGGKVKKVTVAWNSTTSAERTLDVYGSNTAYTAASDLYENSKQGTKLGSIAYGSTELTVTGDYAFVGLRSNSGAMYLDNISIEWESGTPAVFTDYCTTIPEPSITVSETDVQVEASEYEGTISFTYQYLDIDNVSDFDVIFYDSEGNSLTDDAAPQWITTAVEELDGATVVSYIVEANTSAERTASFKVFAAGDEDFIFSNLVTVTQAAGPSATTATIAAACTDGNGKYYGTYSNTSAFILPEGVTASEISVINGELLVENYAAGAVVPANTGVMISSETAGEKTFYLTTGGTSVLGSRNMLHATGNGITAAEMAPSDAPDCRYYRLTMHNGTQIGFWWGAENGGAFAVGANKAYLAVPKEQAKAGFAFEGGDATKIEYSTLNIENSGEMYNLQGQKVGSAYKGIVIVNGKARINK